MNSDMQNDLVIYQLDSDMFERMLSENDNSVVLDVRTYEEHMLARIPNSILIDISKPNFLQEIDKLDRDKHIFIYCRSGNRSYHAAMQMIQMGFTNIYNLENGIIDYNGEIEKN
jgi:rhodanese-related sulfurtransferase